ncbi:MAG: hypothetical protein A2474_02960 [Elusimicrobia bacterium RIFOXYC2_FULL_34_12]|nr:MAG: hypothetical protein A2474_02960 [Elusimicrobia bacterium RIFOXYC2_FULL_34_12]OGS38224.1 MAG: hypothetical protein A2551_03290 [Elusimicrobia bacterium RIFOXYD2_FULL_34_30]HAM38168.1 type II toxin-antitoxin system RelE/ParE family toxin [Elusimicrobiota bacterium]
MYKIIYYADKRDESPVEDFVCSLQLKVRVKVLKWLNLLEEYGPNLPRPYADVLRDKIRELRISHGNLEIRIFYFFWKDKIIVLTNGYFKKQRKTDDSEIEKAIGYMNDFIMREGG